MELNTVEAIVRRLIELYKEDLQDAVNYPSPEFEFNTVTAMGICGAIHYLQGASSEAKRGLEIRILNRVFGRAEYLCKIPIYCDTYNELIYAYQTRISLLEEILFDVTPVEEEGELGTFEKFNNIPY